MQLTLAERDNGLFEFDTGAKSLRNTDILIVTTPAGHYRIEIKGPGQKPDITKDTFTTLPQAKRALIEYLNVHEVDLNKRQLIRDQVERRRREWQEQK